MPQKKSLSPLTSEELEECKKILLVRKTDRVVRDGMVGNLPAMRGSAKLGKVSSLASLNGPRPAEGRNAMVRVMRENIWL